VKSAAFLLFLVSVVFSGAPPIVFGLAFVGALLLAAWK